MLSNYRNIRFIGEGYSCSSSVYEEKFDDSYIYQLHKITYIFGKDDFYYKNISKYFADANINCKYNKFDIESDVALSSLPKYQFKNLQLDIEIKPLH